MFIQSDSHAVAIALATAAAMAIAVAQDADFMMCLLQRVVYFRQGLANRNEKQGRGTSLALMFHVTCWNVCLSLVCPFAYHKKTFFYLILCSVSSYYLQRQKKC